MDIIRLSFPTFWYVRHFNLVDKGADIVTE